MILYQFAQTIFENMGIDFGGSDIGMAQQRLDRPQVGTIGQKMRGKGVAQGVRRDLGGGHPARHRQFLDKHIKSVPRQVPGLAA